MFLTIDTFLQHFPLMYMSKEEFSTRFIVTYTIPQSLYEIFALTPAFKGKPIIRNPETDKRYINRNAIVDYFYEIVILKRHHYLTRFYQTYFEPKDPRTLKWSGVNILEPDTKTIDDHAIISLQKNDPSRRLIRNLFYLELLDKTKVSNTIKSSVSFWQSLLNMYNMLHLEDRFFAPSSIDQCLKAKVTQEINYNALFYLFQAYQPKASIFNPYSIKWILDNIIDKELGYKGQSLFTPVLSWGSYLVAFMHSSYKRYVGVDVMPSVCEKVEFLSNWYQHDMNITKETQIICQPSETLLDSPFQQSNIDSFDVILVCPPYYDMEIYHEGCQSLSSYPNYKQWLDKYWSVTVEMCYKITRKGGIFALIVNDYKALDGKHYPLTEDLNKSVAKHYTSVSMFYLQNRSSPLRVNAKERTERLLIYRKV